MIAVQPATPRRVRGPDPKSIVQAQVRDIVASLPPSTIQQAIQSGGPAMVRLVTAGDERFRIVVELLSGADGEPVPVATVEPVHGHGVSHDDLRGRYRLTEKEARVALLLAERRSNSEIAAALDISPHTARRHTENVMLKLNVTSRFSVESRLRAVA